jgi:hypothetical protein
MPVSATFELVRPFLLLAAVAFMIGFVSCLVFGGPTITSVQAHPNVEPAVISGPASDDWNLPKRI